MPNLLKHFNEFEDQVIQIVFELIDPTESPNEACPPACVFVNFDV